MAPLKGWKSLGVAEHATDQIKIWQYTWNRGYVYAINYKQYYEISEYCNISKIWKKIQLVQPHCFQKMTEMGVGGRGISI